MSASRISVVRNFPRKIAAFCQAQQHAGFATTPRQLDVNKVLAPKTTEPTPPQSTGSESSVPMEIHQAPNRAEVWSRSQRPRNEAMTGPRFEQTDFSLQPQPYSAMELVHSQPVRWTHLRVVSCDGGGGVAGHPRIFINTDKPEIAVCGYCGLPYANEHHRKVLEALPQTSYPL